VSSPVAKNILFFGLVETALSIGYPAPTEGRFAIVTDVGAGCGGRRRRFDEGARLRTAKSCGPDASTLAFKSMEVTPSATVTKKPDHRGEREGNR
jgi:hypothetical protein